MPFVFGSQSANKGHEQVVKFYFVKTTGVRLLRLEFQMYSITNFKLMYFTLKNMLCDNKW